MKRVLKAYAWWAIGVVSAIALAWAYHRRIAGGVPSSLVEPVPAPEPSVEQDA